MKYSLTFILLHGYMIILGLINLLSQAFGKSDLWQRGTEKYLIKKISKKAPQESTEK